MQIFFFAIDESREPHAGLQVGPPAVEVEIPAGMAAAAVSAVKADHVEVLVFDPDATEKAALAGFRKRSHIEHKTAHFTQEFAAHVVELVVLRVEAAGVDENHLQETVGQILHCEREEIADSAENLLALAACIGEGDQSNGFGKIRFAQKIFVAGRNAAKLLVRLQILNIGFNERRVFLHPAVHVVLVAHHTIDNLYHGARFFRDSLRRVIGQCTGRCCGGQRCGAACGQK